MTTLLYRPLLERQRARGLYAGLLCVAAAARVARAHTRTMRSWLPRPGVRRSPGVPLWMPAQRRPPRECETSASTTWLASARKVRAGCVPLAQWGGGGVGACGVYCIITHIACCGQVNGVASRTTSPATHAASTSCSAPAQLMGAGTSSAAGCEHVCVCVCACAHLKFACALRRFSHAPLTDATRPFIDAELQRLGRPPIRADGTIPPAANALLPRPPRAALLARPPPSAPTGALLSTPTPTPTPAALPRSSGSGRCGQQAEAAAPQPVAGAADGTSEDGAAEAAGSTAAGAKSNNSS